MPSLGSEAAETAGQLTQDHTIIEATSGNTGIALAVTGAAKSYRVMLGLSAGVNLERRRMLAALGAEIVLTNAREGTDAAIRRAREVVERAPDQFYLPDQYSNESNVSTHYETTGPEILAQTQGDLDVCVAGMGPQGR